MGCTKDGDEYFVEFFAVHVHYLAEVEGEAFSIFDCLREDVVGDGNGIRTADSNDGDGSTWGRGKGANGILFHTAKIRKIIEQ